MLLRGAEKGVELGSLDPDVLKRLKCSGQYNDDNCTRLTVLYVHIYIIYSQSIWLETCARDVILMLMFSYVIL